MKPISLIFGSLLIGCVPAVDGSKPSAFAQITEVQPVASGTVRLAVEFRNESASPLCLIE